MQTTSPAYRRILSGNHYFETRLAIGEGGLLTDEGGDALDFGGDTILIDTGGPEDGYGENMLISVTTSNQIFSQEPGVGATCAGEINVEMVKPTADIPQRARMALFVRACNDTEKSEWIAQGTFWVDTRSELKAEGWTKLTLHGYDAMLDLEADYPDSRLDFPARDISVVEEIANAMGLAVDPRVYDILTDGNAVEYPGEYSCREVLGYIGAMYAGNWILTADGSLMLITLDALPPETSYLVDEAGDEITFGGDVIIV